MLNIEKSYDLTKKIFSLAKVLSYYCQNNEDIFEIKIISNVLEDIKVLSDKLYVEFIEGTEIE